MQERRFLNITDRLAQKGFNLYPYSDQENIRQGRHTSMILGTHERSMHRDRQLVVIPHENFDHNLLKAIRTERKYGKFIQEIDQDYIVYSGADQINPDDIDQLIETIKNSNIQMETRQRPVIDLKRNTFSPQIETQSIEPQPVQFEPARFDQPAQFEPAKFDQPAQSEPAKFGQQKIAMTSGLGAFDASSKIANIKNKLHQKGYKTYPYNDEEDVYLGKFQATLIGSHISNNHREFYLISIVFKKFSRMTFESIRKTHTNDEVMRLFDLDEDFIVFLYHEQCTGERIDELIKKFNSLNVIAPNMNTMRKTAYSTNANMVQTRNLKKVGGNFTRIKRLSNKTEEYSARAESAFSPSFSSSSLIGKNIQGYQILRELGVGGFGIAYLVQKHESYFVLKISKSLDAQKTIESEISALQSLNTMFQTQEYRNLPSCVPKLYDTGSYDGRAFFIEEFVLTLDYLKAMIYQRINKFEVVDIAHNYYQYCIKKTRDKNIQEQMNNKIQSLGRTFGAKNTPVPLDPIVASIIMTHLALLTYVMNINNYQYGDIKPENIGLRFHNMNIIEPKRLTEGGPFHNAIRTNLVAEQLQVVTGKKPSFCPVLIDFGSFSEFSRAGDSSVFITPKYMIPNELLIKDQTVRTSFLKDPYSLGLTFLSIVSGLDPFWDIKLGGDIDQQIATIKTLYNSRELPFNLDLISVIMSNNLQDLDNPQKGKQ